MQMPLDETDRLVLQVIDEEGVIRGSVLRRRARIKDASELLKSLRKLVGENLIGVSGSISDERSMQEAYFSPVPSTRGILRQAVTKS